MKGKKIAAVVGVLGLVGCAAVVWFVTINDAPADPGAGETPAQLTE